MRSKRRNNSGAVLPLIVVATLLLVAFVAYGVDVTRNLQAVQQLQFAAESAALDAYSKLIAPDGTYSMASGLSNARNAIAESHGGSPWNTAPIGPTNSQTQFHAGVSIDPSDIGFSTNPSDPTEPLLRVTARRSGADSLRFFFLPAIFAMDLMNGSTVPAEAHSASPYRTIEVLGAPASRIGAGAPRSTSAGSTAPGWATLPIGISYSQFLAASLPNETRTTYSIDLLDSRTPWTGAAPAGVIRGAFVNVLRGGAGDAYYGMATGNADINQLVSCVKYFAAAIDANAQSPAVVERGSRLWTFDKGTATFESRRSEVIQNLRSMQPNRHYILPVLASDPVAGQRSTVVGFALLQLRTVSDPSQTNFALTFDVGESLPARNATSATQAFVPAISGNRLPPALPNGPFANRLFDAASNSLPRRYRGVCMAPVTSARSL